MKEKLFDPLQSAVALIADDDDSFRREMVVVLEFFFKKVIQATNGLEALEYCEKFPVDVLFLDYNMPKLNGYETATKIRLQSRFIPIIFMSGNLEESKFINIIKTKPEYFLKKPFYQKDIFEIMSYLKTLLAKRQENILLPINDEYSYDILKRVIMEEEQPVTVTKKESLLIEILLENKSYLVSNQILESKLFENESTPNNLRNLIYRLRKKTRNSFIVNVKDLGYLIP